MVAEVKITSNTIQIANEIKGISRKISSAIKKSLANVSVRSTTPDCFTPALL